MIAVVLAGCLAAGPVGLTQPADPLSVYEQGIFARTFEQEPLASRVSRLETFVFGAPQSGSLADRRRKLDQLLGEYHSSQAPQQAQNHQPQQTMPSERRPSDSRVLYETPDRPADATSYPTVSALEREVFGRDFIYDDLPGRITRLEKRVFRKTYANLPLVDRVDKLKMRYPNVQAELTESAAYTGSVLDDLPDDASRFVGNRDTYTKLSLLEEAILGSTNEGMLITERLDIMEQRAFGYTHKGESVSARVDRLLQGYENRYADTPRQPFQPRPSYQSRRPEPPQTSTASSLRGQNIQIGSGFASSSTHMRFSPELIDMLPNDVRRQVYQQQGYPAPPGQGYTVQSQSTVMFPDGSTRSGTVNQSSSFQTFGGHGGNVEYRSYTSTPGQTTPGQPYTGNPAVVRQLAQLESRVLGRVNTVEPVPVRLGRLENLLAGRTFPRHSDLDRIENLERLYRYQSLNQVLGGQNTPQTVPNLGVPLVPPVSGH